VRPSGGSSVILKEPSSQRPNSDDIERLQRAWEIGHTLEISGLRKPLELWEDGGKTVLVLDDVGGRALREALSEGPLPLKSVLSIGEAIARTLAGLHARGLMHGDVSPGNVIVDGKGDRPWLIDFGLTLELSANRGTPRIHGGTPHYIAPEQTGRTDLILDARSDLYGLGATLYHCLVGKPPFDTTDLGALVQAHLALPPTPPSAAKSDIPAGVSAIVMRLLEKRPGDRYAGAYGVALDLAEAARQLESSGDVPLFDLARRDPPARATLPNTLFCREDELAALRGTLEMVRRGPAALAVLSGRSGAGKTSLAEELLAGAARSGARVGRGKATKVLKAPFSTLAELITSLVDGLLVESQPELEKWGVELRQTLGVGVALVAEFVPKLELIVGPVSRPDTTTSSGQLSNQLGNAFRKLMRSLSSAERPTVLFVDDLQWVDAQSILLLEQLAADSSLQHLLLVCAFRDDEVDPDHPLKTSLSRLRATPTHMLELCLLPLTDDGCRQLVGAMLGESADTVSSLAAPIYEVTGGNPFLVERTVLSLHEEVLRFDVEAGRWIWNLDSRDSITVSDDEAAVLVETIEHLPERTREVLGVAACLGTTLDLEHLAAASGIDCQAAIRDLGPAEDARLIATSAADSTEAEPGSASVRFLHDRIQEAAQGTIAGADRTRVHLQIGRRLKEQFGADSDSQSLFEVVTQLNLGRDALTDPDERLDLARANLRAAKRAMTGVAFEVAADLSSIAHSILGEWGWDTDAELTWEVYRTLAEASMLAGRRDLSREILELVLPRTRDEQARVELELIKVRLCAFESDHAGAQEAVLRVMVSFGFEVPTDDAGWEVAAGAELSSVARLLLDRPVASLAQAKPAVDPEIIRELSSLSELLSVASTLPHLFPVVVARVVRLSIEHGPTEHSPYGYVLFGVLNVALGDPETGDQFGKMALALNRRQNQPALEAKLRHVYGAFVSHWRQPYELAYKQLELGHHGALEYGIFDTAGWTAMILPCLGVARGKELGSLTNTCLEVLATARDALQYEDAVTAIGFALHQIAALRGDASVAERLDAQGLEAGELESRLAHYPMVLATSGTLALQRAVILGDLEEARDRIDFLTDPTTEQLAAGVMLSAEVVFYDSLTCLLDRENSEDPLGHLTKNVERLRVWGKGAPANHLYKQLLIEAEIAVLEDREGEALDLFEKAAEAAEASATPHGTALVLERTAAFHRERGRLRLFRFYLGQAREYWARWGAEARVRQLDRLDPTLRGRPSRAIGPDTTSLELVRLDLQNLDRLSQSISDGVGRETVLRHLVSALLESTGAERCAVLMNHGQELRVAAVGSAGQPTLVADLAPRSQWENLAWEPILFAWRSDSEVILDEAGSHSVFGSDPWISQSQVRSVLCVPVKRGGEPFAVIYLEHSVATSAFSARRAGLVRLAAGLAATTIENAELLRRQRDLSAELATIVADRTRELERLYREHVMILESVADGIIWVGLDGLVTFANPAACRLTGYTSAELVSPHGHSLLHSSRAQALPVAPEQCALCLASTNSSPDPRPVETTIVRRDGAVLHVEQSVYPVVDKSDEHLGGVVVIRDRSARRQLEEQLVQAQKMEAVGLFAGGLAHDFNNLLTPILGNIELVSMQLEADDPSGDLLESAKAAVDKAADLVHQMLAFSRRSELFLAAVDLAGVVDEAVRFLRRSIDRRIEVNWVVPAEPPTVLADAGQLSQVLLNILLNARDALTDMDEQPQSPRIAVTLERRSQTTAATSTSERVAVMTVSDNGIGMPEDVVSRVFEPFFTTKELGQGSGLGLSVAYGIIEQHHGTIEVSSVPDVGTTFTVTLPEYEEPATASQQPARELARGTGRFLVVDDEMMVRDLLTRMLESLGYTVLQACNGAEAVEIHRNEGPSLDGMILDLSMPVMSGRETLEHIRRVDSDIPVLICTGYDVAGTGEGLETIGAQGVLRKPFSFSGLSAAVSKLTNG